MNRISRNALCLCGSGKKYKKCCLPKHEQQRRTDQRPASPGGTQATANTLLAYLDEDDDLVDRSNAIVDLIQAGDLDKAAYAADRLVEDYPDEMDGHERRGQIEEKRGNLKQAARHYRKAAEMADGGPGYDPEIASGLRRQADELDPAGR